MLGTIYSTYLPFLPSVFSMCFDLGVDMLLSRAPYLKLQQLQRTTSDDCLEHRLRSGYLTNQLGGSFDFVQLLV